MPQCRRIKGAKLQFIKGEEALKNASDIIFVPCGQCIACRLQRAQEWGARAFHEMKNHKDAIFVRLSYAPEHLPPSGVQKRHVQLFNKLMRKKYKFRFIACGEYGEKYGRAHYHLLMFGLPATESVRRDIEKAWNKGFVDVRPVIAEAYGRYIAQYACKSYNQSNALMQGYNPPFFTCSLRPAIGANAEFSLVADKIYTDTGAYKIPRYYLKKLEESNPAMYSAIKEWRADRAKIRKDPAEVRNAFLEYARRGREAKLELEKQKRKWQDKRMKDRH